MRAVLQPRSESLQYRILPFDKFESLEKISRATCPVLIIHGTDDWTVPAYHGQILFKVANEPKRAIWVKGAGHNNIVYTNEKLYLDSIKYFVESPD